MGVVIDGEVKAAYNHSDSYPDWLGIDVLDALRNRSITQMRRQAKKIRFVTGAPTPEDMEALKAYSDKGVSTGEDWYSTLRNLQGDLLGTLEAGIMEDYASFALDSLFCEWGYLVNLDDGALEIYKGFQSSHHADGRFASDTENRGYYPIRLVASLDIKGEIPTNEEMMEAVFGPACSECGEFSEREDGACTYYRHDEKAAERKAEADAAR